MADGDTLLHISVESGDAETTVVGLRGEIDISNAELLRARLTTLIGEGHTRLILDLTDLAFMDSSGLSVAIAAYKLVQQHGGTLEFDHARPQVAKVIEISGLGHLLRDNGDV